MNPSKFTQSCLAKERYNNNTLFKSTKEVQVNKYLLNTKHGPSIMVGDSLSPTHLDPLIFSPILQMKKLRNRDPKQLAHHHQLISGGTKIRSL